MHKVSRDIIAILKEEDLTPADFLSVSDKLMNSGHDIETRIIGLLAPLSNKEKEEVMADLASADSTKGYLSSSFGGTKSIRH